MHPPPATPSFLSRLTERTETTPCPQNLPQQQSRPPLLLSNSLEREKSQKQRPYSISRQPSLLERMSPPMKSLSAPSHPTSASWTTSRSLLERISPGKQHLPLELQEPLNQKPLSNTLLHRPLLPPISQSQTLMLSSFLPQVTQQTRGDSIKLTQKERSQKRG